MRWIVARGRTVYPWALVREVAVRRWRSRRGALVVGWARVLQSRGKLEKGN